MLTLRNVFSRSFTISATCVDETAITVSTDCSYSAFAASVQLPLCPPTTFGMFFVLYCLLPGSIRSGENARAKSLPASRPPASSAGRTTSSVVPGYVVLSRMTS
jgi:hypothetical protein